MRFAAELRALECAGERAEPIQEAATLPGSRRVGRGAVPPLPLRARDARPRPDHPHLSGERRLSNYLLWQSAYSELVFREELWPDFTRAAAGAVARRVQRPPAALRRAMSLGALRPRRPGPRRAAGDRLRAVHRDRGRRDLRARRPGARLDLHARAVRDVRARPPGAPRRLHRARRPDRGGAVRRAADRCCSPRSPRCRCCSC